MAERNEDGMYVDHAGNKFLHEAEAERSITDANWGNSDSNNSPPPKSSRSSSGKSVKARILKELQDMVGIIFKQ